MHVHINPVGGIAGDMFIAAAIDLMPDLMEPCFAMIGKVSSLASLQLEARPHNDGTLTGRRFILNDSQLSKRLHVRFSEVQKELLDSNLDSNTKEIACDIFFNLAEAEAKVHDVEVRNVHLHEVGAIDSMADIVGAAFLIQAMNVQSWSCDPVPGGSGTVETQHGPLPIPAPAVVELLHNAPMYSDGRIGERVTPTGAAILKYLNPSYSSHRGVMTLAEVGTGFGSRKFERMSNVLRLVSFDTEVNNSFLSEQISILEFEIDDQPMEDLSVGLANIREHDGVLDVLQVPGFGKKGRMTVQIQVLCKVATRNEVADLCFSETSTIGLRILNVERLSLDRDQMKISVDDVELDLKLAKRPSGQITAKAESRDLANVGDYANRKLLKSLAELEAECVQSEENE